MSIKKILLIILGVIVLAIFSLEIMSRIYKCPTPVRLNPCFAPGQSLPTSINQESKTLANLRNKRLAGEKISKSDYRQAADELILEVEPRAIEGYYNGIACGNIGYVRNDLPREAKKFVKRHELEHLLQVGPGIGRGKNQEFSANLAAGKEYPLGLIQTTFFSIWKRLKSSDSLICGILSTWKTFKIYFLP